MNLLNQSVFVVLVLFALIGQQAVAQPMMDVEASMSPSGEECEGSVMYKVSADFVWSAVTHPIDYPAGSAHWSRLSGTTHNENYQMWDADILSTPGVKQVAELGVNAILRGEIEECGEDCTPMFGFACDMFSGTCSASGTVEVTPERPLLSAISMVAPSPDWFAGVHDLPLCVDGAWENSITVVMFVYDAGTDSGPSYLSTNEVTTPPEPIFLIEGEDTVLYNPTEMKILPVGNFTVKLEA